MQVRNEERKRKKGEEFERKLKDPFFSRKSGPLRFPKDISPEKSAEYFKAVSPCK
jgi:hypothetical protein